MNLLIDIQARFAQFQDGLDQIQRDTARRAKQMERAFESVGKAVQLAFVGHEVKRFVCEIFEATVRADKAQQQLASTLR